MRMDFIVLLSGGSGKRLWPLSGQARSKQYIRFLADEQTEQPCSMVQRVWKQLKLADLTQKCIICAAEQQKEILQSQLGNVRIATEPEGRDTFPAVALSCAYLKSKMGATDGDTVCIMPVDPYTEQSYFETVKKMPGVLTNSGAEIVLMGIQPQFPSGSYGYLLPEKQENGYFRVHSFVEKPGEKEAKTLISQGALWNGGVFCLRIGTVLQDLKQRKMPEDFEDLYSAYSQLPHISFDYAVVEKCGNLAAVSFPGMWKDIGTWDNAVKIISRNTRNSCVEASCRNVFAINETNIPIVAVGVQNLIIAASNDGILVADSTMDLHLKQLISNLSPRPSFEEKNWGTSTVLDFFQEGKAQYLVRKLLVKPGKTMQCEGEKTAKSVSVLKGRGTLTMDGKTLELLFGACFSVPAGRPFSIRTGKTGVVLILSQKGAPGSLGLF